MEVSGQWSDSRSGHLNPRKVVVVVVVVVVVIRKHMTEHYGGIAIS
jgi:hypothetical protein